MKYKLLVFDLDGTLVDTREDLAAAVNEMRKHYQLPILPQKEVVSYVGDGARKLVERSLKGENIDTDQALKVMLSSYEENICVFSKIYEGCLAFLNDMKNSDVQMAVLTNKPQSLTNIILEELKLTQYFNPIFGPEGAACHKPEPGGLLQCVEINNCTSTETLMIGDHHTDLRVAQNAGIDKAFFTGGMGHDDEIVPEITFNSYQELANKLS